MIVDIVEVVVGIAAAASTAVIVTYSYLGYIVRTTKLTPNCEWYDAAQ